jgi:hypothetical protein
VAQVKEDKPMNRTITLTAALAAGLALATIAAASDEKAGQSGVTQETARLNRSKNLTPQQIQAIIVEKSAGHAARVREMHSPAPRPVTASAFRGIVEAEDIPNPFRADELTIVNFWGGESNGKPIGVYSTYRADDPSHGVLVVFDDKDNTRGTRYDVPGGPMSLVAAANGTLTLQARSRRTQFDLTARRFN